MTSVNDVKLFSLAKITEDLIVLKYTEHPFSNANKVAMKGLLSFPALPDPSPDWDGNNVSTPDILLQPPFIPNYQSLAVDCRQVKERDKYMNTENANTFLLIQRIMYILYSGTKNLPVETMIGDSCFMRLITYTLRYQCGHAIGSAAIKTHGAMTAVYNFPHTETISESPNEIIGATMVIVDMINTALTFVDERPERNQAACESKLKAMARLIGSTFSMLDTKGGNPSIDETVAVLGKICNIDSSRPTFSFSHKIYSTCINLFPPVFSSKSSLQLEFYEINDSFKKKLTSKFVKGQKGSVLFLQHLLYKCFLLSSIRLVRNLVSSRHCETIHPRSLLTWLLRISTSSKKTIVKEAFF